MSVSQLKVIIQALRYLAGSPSNWFGSIGTPRGPDYRDPGKVLVCGALLDVFRCWHDPVHAGLVDRSPRSDEEWGEPEHSHRVEAAVNRLGALLK